MSFVFVLILIVAYYFVIRFWLSKNFSPEVDAALITALITIPVGLLTVLGTVWVSITANRKLTATTILQQRTGVRDLLVVKRLELYEELFLKTYNLVHSIGFFLVSLDPDEEKKASEYMKWLEKFYFKNILHLSFNLKLSIFTYLFTEDREIIDFGYPSRMNEAVEFYDKTSEYIDSDQFRKDIIKTFRKDKKYLDDNLEKIIEISSNVNNSGIVSELISQNWLQKHFGKDLSANEMKKGFVIKRCLGFIASYKRKNKDKVVVFEEYIYVAEVFYTLIAYIIESEVDFDVIEKDLNYLYNKEINLHHLIEK